MEYNKIIRFKQINKMSSSISFYCKYQKQQFIGKGTFGSVYKVRQLSTKQIYAAKFIYLYGLSQKQIEKAYDEQKIHSSLTHHNIVKFYESYIQQEEQHAKSSGNINPQKASKVLIFVMQFCQYGDLEFYIKKRYSETRHKQSTDALLPEDVIINIFIQLLYGLHYLHQHGIIHRDLKPSNIFVSTTGAVKIADFGISKILTGHNKYTDLSLTSSQSSSGQAQLVGTPLYSSPQSFYKKQKITHKADIWSLGCILFQLCTLRHVFEADNILALSIKISSQKVTDIGSIYSDDLNALVHWMLEKKAQQRPSASQILQLSFIKKYIKLFAEQFPKNHEQYLTPKKLRATKSVNSNSSKSSSKTADHSPMPSSFNEETYQVISVQVELNQQELSIQENKNQLLGYSEYYQKLKQSCTNLLGKEAYIQMYNQILELRKRIVIVNSKDKKKITNQLKQVYGSQYFDLAKAVMELIEIEDSREQI